MKNLLYIGNKLSNHGFNTTTIETLGKSFECEGFKVIYSSSKKKQVARLFDMIATTLLNIYKVDFVIIDTYSTSSFYYALVISQICRIFKIKYIPILHGGNLPLRLKKNPNLCNLIFKNSYKNVAPSNYLKSEFLKDFNDNLIYIPNTIEIKNYDFYDRETKVPKLLWVRSFSKIYNPKMAIIVLAELKKKFPDAELCMVGPDKENLIDKCKLFAKSLNLEVKFTGKLSKSEWIKLSKEYNIFINTTHFDNTPISVIESMALGLPIVSTNVGGIPFLLSNKFNSILVNDNDAMEMVDAVETILLNNSLRLKMIGNARMLAATFDWNEVRKKWFKVLK